MSDLHDHLRAMAIAEGLQADPRDCGACDMSEVSDQFGYRRWFHAEDCWYRQYVIYVFGPGERLLRSFGIYPDGEELG